MTVVWLEDVDGAPAALPEPPALVLLHFRAPVGHAGHVLVRAGGVMHALASAAARAGPVVVARVWTGTEAELAAREAAIRTAGSRARYCPVCRTEGRKGRS